MKIEELLKKILKEVEDRKETEETKDSEEGVDISHSSLFGLIASADLYIRYKAAEEVNQQGYFALSAMARDFSVCLFGLVVSITKDKKEEEEILIDKMVHIIKSSKEFLDKLRKEHKGE